MPTTDLFWSLDGSSEVNVENLERMPLNSSCKVERNHGTFVRVNSVSGERRKDSQGVVFTEARDKLPEKPTRRRLVEKNGQRNVRSRYIPRTRYFQDIFTTMIDAKWRWVMMFCMASYVLSWLFFSLIWYLILIIHGLDDKDKCLLNVDSFSSSFLLSVETQQTIGYGTRQLTPKCGEAIILLLVQSVVGELIEAVVLGLIFTKLARPGKRASTVVFSNNAVIAKRDGKFCLMFQACDVRKRQLLEAHVRLHLFRPKKTDEGRHIPYFQQNMKVGFNWTDIESDNERLFLLFPITLIHVIDEKSPLYEMSLLDLRNSGWEVVVILEGVVEATGSTTQARTSYLADEILWGHDFADAVDPDEWRDDDGLRFVLDRINETFPVPTPSCSAKEFYNSRPLSRLSAASEESLTDNNTEADK